MPSSNQVFQALVTLETYLVGHDLETDTSAIDRLYDKYGRIAGFLTFFH